MNQQLASIAESSPNMHAPEQTILGSEFAAAALQHVVGSTHNGKHNMH